MRLCIHISSNPFHPPNNHRFIKFPFFIRCRFFYLRSWPCFASFSFLHTPHLQVSPSSARARFDKKAKRHRGKIMYITTWFEFVKQIMFGGTGKDGAKWKEIKWNAQIFLSSTLLLDTSKSNTHEAIFSFFIFTFLSTFFLKMSIL